MTEEELKARAIAYIQESVDVYYDALDCDEFEIAKRAFKTYVSNATMFEHIFGGEVNIKDRKVYVEEATT